MRGLITKLSSAVLSKLEETGSIEVDGKTFNLEEIIVKREPLDGTDASSNAFISIDLPCTLDQELIDEGVAREVVNRIQKTRKEINLNVEQRIKLDLSCDDALKSIM